MDKMKTAIIAALIAIGTVPALADTLTEIAQFTDTVCRDIPEGNLTKTAIQGKVEANAGLLAKILSSTLANFGVSAVWLERG